MFIVGQLVEATKAASDGLKSMSVEVQSNAKAIIAASQTLQAVEDKLSELDHIIRDSTHAGNIVGLTQAHATELTALKTMVTELSAIVTTLKADLNKLGLNQTTAKTESKLLWTVAKVAVVFLGWVATTAIAAWAASTNGK